MANCDKSLSLYDVAGGSNKLLRSFALGRSVVGETELYRQQLRIPQPTPEFLFNGRRAPELDGSVLKKVWEAANSKLLQRVWAYRESFDVYKATTMPLTSCEVSSVACTSSLSLATSNSATMFLGLRNGHIDCYSARIDRSAIEGEIEQRLDPVGIWQVHSDEVTQLQCQRENDLIISSGMDSDVHMCHIERGTVLKTLRGTKSGTLRSHSRGVRGFDISHTPNLLGTFGLERFAILWDPLVGKPLHVLHGHTARIVDLKFSPQRDNMIFTYSDDLTLRVWDMRTLRCIQQLRDQPWEMMGKPASIFYDKNHHRIITCANRLYAKAAVSPEMRQEKDAHSMPILSVSYCSKERSLLSMDEGSMRMWNTDNGCLTALRKRDALRCAILDGTGFAILVDSGSDEVQVVGSSSNDPQMIFNPSGGSTEGRQVGGGSTERSCTSEDTRYIYWDAGYWISLTKRWVRFYACTSTDSKLVHFVEPRHQFSSTLITGKITSVAIVGDKLVVGSSLGYMYTFPIGFLAHTEGASARFSLLDGLPRGTTSPSEQDLGTKFHSVLIGRLHSQVRPIVWRAGATAAFRTHKIILGHLSARGREISSSNAAENKDEEGVHAEGREGEDDVGDVVLAMRSLDGLAAVAEHVVCAVSAGGIFSLWNLRERCELFRWQGTVLSGRVSITALEGSTYHQTTGVSSSGHGSATASTRSTTIRPVLYYGDDTGYIGSFDFTQYVSQALHDPDLSQPALTDDAAEKYAASILRTSTFRVDIGAINCLAFVEDRRTLCVGTATAKLLIVEPESGAVLRVLGEAITPPPPITSIELDEETKKKNEDANTALPHTDFYLIVMNMHRMEAIAQAVEQMPRTEKEIVSAVLISHPLLFPSEKSALTVLHAMSPLQPELFLERLLERSFQGLYQCLREKQRTVKITNAIHREFDLPPVEGGDGQGEDIEGRAYGALGSKSADKPSRPPALSNDLSMTSTVARTPDSKAKPSSPTGGLEQQQSPNRTFNGVGGGPSDSSQRSTSPVLTRRGSSKRLRPSNGERKKMDVEAAADDLVDTWAATERALDAPMAAKPFARTLPSHQLLLDTLEADIRSGGGGAHHHDSLLTSSANGAMEASTTSSTTAVEPQSVLEAALRRRRSTIHGPDRLPPFLAHRRSEVNRLSALAAAAAAGGALSNEESALLLYSRGSFLRKSVSLLAGDDLDFIPFPPLAAEESPAAKSYSNRAAIITTRRPGIPTTHQEDTLLREEFRGRETAERCWAHGYDSLVVSCILDRIWVCFWTEMTWALQDIEEDFTVGKSIISNVVEPSAKAYNAIVTFEQQHWKWLTSTGAERAKRIASSVVRPRLIRYNFSTTAASAGSGSKKHDERLHPPPASHPDADVPLVLVPPRRGSSFPRRYRRVFSHRRRHSANSVRTGKKGHHHRHYTDALAEQRNAQQQQQQQSAKPDHRSLHHQTHRQEQKLLEAEEKLFWSRAAEPATPSFPVNHELMWASEWSRANDLITVTERDVQRKVQSIRGLTLSFAARSKAFVMSSIVGKWDPAAAAAAQYVWISPDGICAHLVTNPVNRAAANNVMTHARKCASHELKSIATFLAAQWDGPLRCHAPLACVVQYACLTFFCSCTLPIDDVQDRCLVQDAAPVASTMLRQAFEAMNLEPPVSRLSIPFSFRLFLAPNGVHWATGVRRLLPVEGPRSGDPEIATALLRPELVRGVAGRLCCSAFDSETPIAVRKRSDRDVIKAGRKVTHVQIGELTAFLSTDAVSGKTSYLDGGLVGHLHRFGVNLRYLAQVAFSLIRVATKDAEGAGSAGNTKHRPGGGGKTHGSGSKSILRPWAAAETQDAPRQLLIMKVVTSMFDEIVARAFRAILQADTEAMFFPSSAIVSKKSTISSNISSVRGEVGRSNMSPSLPTTTTHQNRAKDITNKISELLQLLLGTSDGSAQFWSDRVDPMIAVRFPPGDFADHISLEDIDTKHLLRRISELCTIEIDYSPESGIASVKTSDGSSLRNGGDGGVGGGSDGIGARVKVLKIEPYALKLEDLERASHQLQQVNDATAAVQQQLSFVRMLRLSSPSSVIDGDISRSTGSTQPRHVSDDDAEVVVGGRDEAWLLRHLFRINAISRNVHTAGLHIRRVAEAVKQLFLRPWTWSSGRKGGAASGGVIEHTGEDFLLAEAVCALNGARYEDALAVTQTLKSTETARSPSTSSYATSVQLWASLVTVDVNVGAGCHDTALKCSEELLTLTKASARGGRCHVLELADALQIVADLYSCTSSSMTYQRQARELLLERYHLLRQVLPPHDALVLSSIKDLAASHLRMEEEQEAIALLDKLLACGERWIGANSPFVLDILGRLGHACVSVGNYEAAESVFARVLTLCDSHYGQDLPVKARARLNMCEMHLSRGHVPSAWHEMKLAQSIALGLPFNDPVLLSQLQLEAKLHMIASAYELALAAWTKILDARERTLGPLHVSTSDAMFEIAIIMFRQRKYHECWHVLDVCLTIRKQILSEHHPVTAFTLAWLARSEAAAGNIVEAVEYFEQSSALFDKMVPVTDAMNVSFPKMRAQCLLDVASLLLHDVRAASQSAEGPTASSSSSNSSNEIKEDMASQHALPPPQAHWILNTTLPWAAIRNKFSNEHLSILPQRTPLPSLSFKTPVILLCERFRHSPTSACSCLSPCDFLNKAQ